jgi:hypothetical protein
MKTIGMGRCLLLVVLLAGLLAGCNTGPRPVLLEGQERDDILAKVEPLTDEIFAGMNARDYALFSRNFDPKMKAAMDEYAFLAMVDDIQGKVGPVVSREVRKVERVGEFIAVTYNARFEQEESVSWRVVVRPGDPLQVSGLWYDSPKLRAQ